MRLFEIKNHFLNKTILLLVLFSCNFLFSKPSLIQFYNNKKYDSVLDNVGVFLNVKDLMQYENGLNLIKKIEQDLISKKDFKDLAVLYFNVGSIYYYNKDMSQTRFYLGKGMEILKKYPNNELLGFYYETYYASYSSIGKFKIADEFLLKSKYYLEKYTDVEKRADLYYNLCFYSDRNEKWSDLILYANKHDSICKNIFNVNSAPNLYLMKANALLNLNNLQEAKKTVLFVENLERFKKQETKVLHRYYELLGSISNAENNYKKAIEYYQLALKYKDLYGRETLETFNSSAVLENKILQTNFQLEKEKIDNKLNHSKLKFQKSLLIYLIISLAFLISLIFLQFRYNGTKTKMNKALNEKNELLKEALVNRNKFLDIISHELRTPLNAISSILYLFKEKKENVDKQNLEILEYSTEYLKTLTNNIIEYNVLNDNKKVKLRPASNSVLEIVNKCITSFEKVNLNNNHFVFEFDDKIFEFHLVDKARLIQVLNNLLDNANKFTFNGIIKVAVILESEFEDEQILRFCIEDEGIGINDDIKDKIFEMFFQGSEEISIKYGGSGIGLTLVESTLKMFNSNIKYKAKEKGSIFYFDLKLEKASQSENFYNSIKEKLDCNKNEILVVEDNKINQLLVERILVEKGFKVTLADNGLEALKIVKKHDFCLILMDIMMPVMDGFVASEEIGKVKPEIPIVALTAVSEELNKDKFQKALIRKVLNKPINIEELTKTVNHYCLN